MIVATVIAIVIGIGYGEVQRHYANKRHALGWMLALPPTVAVPIIFNGALEVLLFVAYTYVLARAWVRWHAGREIAKRR